MGKGIHTVTQQRRVTLHSLTPCLLIAGILLFWTADAGFGQESESQATPEQSAETAPAPVAAEATQWERQIDELNQRRQKLEESASSIEEELEQAERQQEQRRRQLQEQLEDIHSQIRDVAAQTFELQRERLRRDYLRELEALKQSYQPLEEMEEESVPPLGAERPVPWRRELVENVEAMRRELREVQEQREQDGSRWGGLRERLRTILERIEAVEEGAEKAHAAIEEGRTERQALTECQAASTRRQEELGEQVRQVAEQQRSLTEQAGALSGVFRRDIDRLGTDLQRTDQKVGRVEQERMEAQSVLKTEVRELGERVRELREGQMRMQGAVDMLLSQSGRSTVGSGGYTWGW